MKTIFLRFRIDAVDIRLSGLSFKKLKSKSVERDLYRADFAANVYCLATQFTTDSKTAQIEIEALVDALAQIKEAIPFERIELESHYQINAEELLKLVNDKNKKS